ncbi:MAG: transketolase [Deltaproteobacteria bacterium]|nr:transketolase [Deltaproteobacteria bacterium]
MSAVSAGRDRIAQLQARAARLREHSLRATSEANSGHPTSCLSAADLVAALFFDVMRYDPLDPGNIHCDRFVLSKGHAAPLLYAAWAEAGAFPVEKLLTLRRIDSELEGHPTPHFAGTVAATGSLGQGLSVGVGAAWSAKQIDHSEQRIFVLCGDGEMAEGSAWEAIALAAHAGLDNLVAIVDVNALGQSQRTMYGHDVNGYVARFAAFGWHAIPIDGHDMEAILAAFEEARDVHGKPVAIIARTNKGHGVAALADKDNWHGKPVKKGADLDAAIAEVRAAAPQVELRPVAACIAQPTSGGKGGESGHAMAPPAYKADDQVATREAYGTALAKLGAVNADVVVIDADTKNSTFAERFLHAHPGRYLEAYIAEQNMVGAAVGLSAAGKVPFVSSFACFLTRAFDHIRMAAISRANLKLAGSHCGVSIGEDGPSQMGLEDLAMMRTIPHATVLYPSDAVSTERLVEEMANERGIHYLRLTRPKAGILYDVEEEFPVGGSKLLRHSDKDALLIVAAGVTLWEALGAHDLLAKDGINVRVVDAYSIKPIDADGLRAAARACGGRVLTVEDHYAEGGLGDAVLNALAGEPVKVAKIAVNDVPRSGKPEELLKLFGLDAASIAARAREIVAK